MINISNISDIINCSHTELTSLYIWGSRAYQTNNSSSDWDVICVGDNLESNIEYRVNEYNIHTTNTVDWINNLNNHQIKEVECLFIPNDCKIINNYSWDFILDKQKLRHVWSAKASNSWVKAKKKIDKEKEWYIGIKSLFHSLRIIDFAIQLAKNSSIDINSCNSLWEEISKIQPTSWENLQQIYQPIYNNSMTEFRKFAPK